MSMGQDSNPVARRSLCKGQTTGKTEGMVAGGSATQGRGASSPAIARSTSRPTSLDTAETSPPGLARIDGCRSSRRQPGRHGAVNSSQLKAMISIDANLLLYAYNEDSPRHKSALTFLTGLAVRDDVAISELVLT